MKQVSHDFNRIGIVILSWCYTLPLESNVYMIQIDSKYMYTGIHMLKKL